MTAPETGYPWETPPDLWRGLAPRPGWRGMVAAIYIAPRAAAEMVEVRQVRAFRDRGLEGDRFLRGSWSSLQRPDKAVSLIESETLELAAKEVGDDLVAQKSRRNIVTRGVPLIDLLGREFNIGDVRLRGLRLFEPCAHLVALSKIPAIFKALEHRSGLKCAILTDGTLNVGDAVALDCQPWPVAAQQEKLP